MNQSFESMSILVRMGKSDSYQQHLLMPGESWTCGRSRRSSVVIKREELSKTALLLRFPEERSPKSGIYLFALQHAMPIRISNDSGDRFSLSRGGPPIRLRDGAKYAVHLHTFSGGVKILFTTPGGETDDSSPSDTLSWSVSGAAPRKYPQYIDVAALVCAIETIPTMRPIVSNGKHLSPHSTLKIAVEIFLHRTSEDFVQEQLVRALREMDIQLTPNLDKQSRVALAYSGYYKESKLTHLSNSLKDDIAAIANS